MTTSPYINEALDYAMNGNARLAALLDIAPNGLLICDTPTFALYSHGNGWAYTFINKATDRKGKHGAKSLWFQDDDAQQFRDEYDRWQEARPEMDYQQILGELWFQYA